MEYIYISIFYVCVCSRSSGRYIERGYTKREGRRASGRERERAIGTSSKPWLCSRPVFPRVKRGGAWDGPSSVTNQPGSRHHHQSEALSISLSLSLYLSVSLSCFHECLYPFSHSRCVAVCVSVRLFFPVSLVSFAIQPLSLFLYHSSSGPNSCWSSLLSFLCCCLSSLSVTSTAYFTTHTAQSRTRVTG